MKRSFAPHRPHEEGAALPCRATWGSTGAGQEPEAPRGQRLFHRKKWGRLEKQAQDGLASVHSAGSGVEGLSLVAWCLGLG